MDERAQALVAAGQRIREKNLTWGAAGNLSCRLESGKMLITRSGAVLGDLTSADFVVCDFQGRTDSGVRPSVEKQLHGQIYQQRPDIAAVLHASPFYTTLVASSRLEPDPTLTTDTAYYLRQIRRVPYAPPSSADLAVFAAHAAQHSDILLLENHGSVILGNDPGEAATRLEALELLCHMTVLGQLGIPLHPLGEVEVDSLLRQLAGYGKV